MTQFDQELAAELYALTYSTDDCAATIEASTNTKAHGGFELDIKG